MLDGIFLNGTSSAGKSSIADAIIAVTDLPFVRLCIDDFLSMVEYRHLDCPPIDGITPVCERLILGYQECIGGMIRAGNVVLVDHVLQEPTWKEHMRTQLNWARFVRVGVHCPIDVLREREKIRGDREIGLAELQYARVHVGLQYDLEVDTSRMSPDECARKVLGLFSVRDSR